MDSYDCAESYFLTWVFLDFRRQRVNYNKNPNLQRELYIFFLFTDANGHIRLADFGSCLRFVLAYI